MSAIVVVLVKEKVPKCRELRAPYAAGLATKRPKLDSRLQSVVPHHAAQAAIVQHTCCTTPVVSENARRQGPKRAKASSSSVRTNEQLVMTSKPRVHEKTGRFRENHAIPELNLESCSIKF